MKTLGSWLYSFRATEMIISCVQQLDGTELCGEATHCEMQTPFGLVL